MNDDMPWLNLTQEEVEELRSKKQELTQYGKEKIRELMMNRSFFLDSMFQEENYENVQGSEELENAQKWIVENFQQTTPEKTFDDLTKEQKIQLALNEVDLIEIGVQNDDEFYDSIQFIRKILNSFK